MTYRHDLEHWYLANEQALTGSGFETHLNWGEETANPAIFVGFDLTLAVARGTVWDSGELDMEVLGAFEQSIPKFEHYKVTSQKELHDLFDGFVERLKNDRHLWESVSGF